MPVRIAVIGAGVYGTHVLNVLSAAVRSGEADLEAVADIAPQTLERAVQRFQIRGYANYHEMLERESLDAVVVVTPDHLHRQAVLDAAAHRLHILCQKPIATRTEEGYEMIAAAQDAGVLLAVDFHKRYDPAHRELKRSIRQGRLGQILYGDVYMEDRIEVPAVWFKSWADRSSPAWFLGTHFYDLVSWLLEARPVRVFAHGNKRKLLSMGIDSYDHVSAAVVYDNGAVITFHASWILPDGFPSIVNQQIRLIGTEGIGEIDSQDRGFLSCFADQPGCQVSNPFAKSEPLIPDSRFDLPLSGYTCDSIRHFVQLAGHLKRGAVLADLAGSYPDGSEAMIATRTCEAIHDSLQAGRLVDIDPASWR